MKKQILIGLSLLVSALTFSQTFFDNFDSYTPGIKLGPQSAGAWTTWSNAPGGAEDVNVSNAFSSSPSNSLYFSSTSATGGPVDVVRHFGVLNTGQFVMEFNMKVNTGKAAYFNLQKTAVMGNTYALDAYFRDNGTVVLDQVSSFSATYPQDSWFNFRLEINFNINKWEIFIDNVSAGYFSNTVNQIEAIDIFPVDPDAPNSSQFYIDDFQTTITPYVLPLLNAGVTYVGFNGGNIATNAVVPLFKVKNLGISAITSFDITCNYNGIDYNQSYSALSMNSLVEQSFTITTPIILVAGSNLMTYTVSNVNGNGQDDDIADDESSTMVSPIVPALGKMVVGEEGTGTWCQWCPRGAVYMDLFETDYADFWAGIAVHNADPMTVTDYDTEINSLIQGFYPSSIVDRGPFDDPSAMGNEFFTRLQTAPIAFIENGATWDAGTRTLNVSISADFQTAASNSYKLACVLTEDNVTGTTSGYNQSNAYAGGASGVMGGYELLPSSVPASLMVYNHVARVIAPSFSGEPMSFPAVVNVGETHTLNMSFVLPTTWDENEIHIIGMLIAPNGRIDNAGKATIAEAVANGFVVGNNASVTEINSDQLDATFRIFPNPTAANASVGINLTAESTVSLKFMDMSGKVIAERNYGSLNGSSTVELNTSDLRAGVYLIELTVNNEVMVKRLIVE
ncbi:MAG: hypothetical protein RI883_239 [Bacteroidota bacterium]|jgi:hypothetical protein